MDIKELIKSKTVRAILLSASGIAVVLSIFQLGAAIGYRKAAFSYRMGDNYHKIFDGRPGERNPGLPPQGLMPGHGSAGLIMKMELPNVIVETPDNTEQSIITNERTIVKRFRETIKPGDLMVGDTIVVIGSPNEDGQIEAKLIRTIPSPSDMGPEASR
ncbi:MAG: hypothetical protein PHG66_02915 [Candidatus Colwellbacteria bacterium]|nr:hypothetical protein [Candidatus Colwellbacteria bacterium]